MFSCGGESTIVTGPERLCDEIGIPEGKVDSINASNNEVGITNSLFVLQIVKILHAREHGTLSGMIARGPQGTQSQ